jgi:hypothetical protein
MIVDSIQYIRQMDGANGTCCYGPSLRPDRDIFLRESCMSANGLQLYSVLCRRWECGRHAAIFELAGIVEWEFFYHVPNHR